MWPRNHSVRRALTDVHGGLLTYAMDAASVNVLAHGGSVGQVAELHGIIAGAGGDDSDLRGHRSRVQERAGRAQELAANRSVSGRRAYGLLWHENTAGAPCLPTSISLNYQCL